MTAHDTIPLPLPSFYDVDRKDKLEWTNTEVHGCKDNGIFTEQVDDDEADFFSVYVRLSWGGLECIADLATRAQAEELARTIERIAPGYIKP